MPTRRSNPKRWVAIAMIALGMIILVASLGVGHPGYYARGMYGMYGPGMYGAGMYGPGMYGPGMYAHPYHQYGHQLMGNGPMWGAWTGRYGTPYPGAMMFDSNLMPDPDTMQGLNLTQDQRARIDAIESQAGEKRWNLVESLNAENGKLNVLFLGESVDADALKEQYARCAQLRRRIFELGLKERKQLDEVLSDDQRRQWHRLQNAFMTQ